MSIRFNQSGFAAIETALVVSIVAIIAATGYFVWNAKESADKSLDAASKVAPFIDGDRAFFITSQKMPPDWYLYSSDKASATLGSADRSCILTAIRHDRKDAKIADEVDISTELYQKIDDERVNHEHNARLGSREVVLYTNAGSRTVKEYKYQYKTPEGKIIDNFEEVVLVNNGNYATINTDCRNSRDLEKADQARSALMINT